MRYRVAAAGTLDPVSVAAQRAHQGATPADHLRGTAATALIVGGIVGAGTFNLQTNLASFGPISSPTTAGVIALGDAVRRVVAGMPPAGAVRAAERG